MRTAKPCGPGAPMQGVKFSRKLMREATVANKLVHRGEHGVSRKPLRREGRCDTACTCGHAPFAQSFWREGPGCSGHPAFPAPSVSQEGRGSWHNSGESRRENAKACPSNV